MKYAIKRSHVTFLAYNLIDCIIIIYSIYISYILININVISALEINLSNIPNNISHLKVIILVIFQFLCISNRFYNEGLRSQSINNIFKNILICISITYIIYVFFVYVLLQLQTISLYLIVVSYIITILNLLIEKIIIKVMVQQIRVNSYSYKNLLIVGCDKNAFFLTNKISHYCKWEYKVIGFLFYKNEIICDEIDKSHILGVADNIKKVYEKYIVDDVLFVIGDNNFMKINELIDISAIQGKTIHVSLNLFTDLSLSKFRYNLYDTTPIFTYHSISLNHIQLILKRAIDILISIIGFILFLFFYIIFGPIIKISSKGPILFKQKRIGMNNRVFYIYKFRTMMSNAEDLQSNLKFYNELNGPIFKIKADPRITKIGKILRRTSIDEFPQFINVLRNDMSVVGTRPPLLNETAAYKDWQKRRISIKPGITGMWQVSGRNAIIDFDRIVQLDLFYIDNWSLLLDLKIIFKTLCQLFTRNGY